MWYCGSATLMRFVWRLESREGRVGEQTSGSMNDSHFWIDSCRRDASFISSNVMAWSL